jgi:AcrR family transcriptional regulator
VQNAIPENAVHHLAEARALRALAGRHEAYTDEVRRLLDAAFAVMRRSGSVSPRVSEIVREAGLSNQAFYRHFASKDELLVAVLEDGLQQLVGYLEHRMARAGTPIDKVREWVAGVLAQAADAQAASSTRPFVVNSLRLRDRFRDEVQRSDELLKAPLRAALADVPGADPERDTEAVYQLAMGRMHAQLIRGERPTRRDVEHLVEFAVRGLERAHGPSGRERARGA